nr:MAG TPA: hypothetical protein [Caudoviricetes sp.]
MGIVCSELRNPPPSGFFYACNSPRHARRNSTTEPFRGEP